MRLGDFSGIISTMFTDKMSVNRYQDKENPDKTTDTILSDTPIYSDVPCRVSFASRENPDDNELDNTPVKISPKIFCGKDVDIKAGDFVTVKRFDDDGNVTASYSGKIGMPSVFITHKEALFVIEESA